MLEELFEAELNDAAEQEALKPPTVEPGAYKGRVVEYKLREDGEPDGVLTLIVEFEKLDGKMTTKYVDVFPYPLKSEKKPDQFDMRFIHWSRLRKAVAPNARKVIEVLEASKQYPFVVKLGKVNKDGKQYIDGFKAIE